MNRLNIKTIPSKYRPIPFWSWNDKLDTAELCRQSKMMANAGMGGYFMHARCGLQTDYLSDEWFDCIKAGIDSAVDNNMHPWAYDENGWPSGFASGIVNGMGEKYQQKKLRIEEGYGDTPHTVCNAEGYHIYYEVNPFYVDTLDGEVIREFIKNTHDEYYRRFGSQMKGFFTDEPEAGNGNIPWSLTLPEEYKKEYNEDLLPLLPQLFRSIGDYRNTRAKFWRLVTMLFSNNYVKQLYDWCDEHGMMLTGHLTGETNLRMQMTPNGACMPHYQYFHIPGIDWLGRNIRDSMIIHQVVSAAMQTGKKQILTESYAMCGHNVSFSELRRIYEWQAVRGVNLLCQHLEGYSMRGVRKRDYPPALFYQQPWWSEYKAFNDAISRIGMLIADGRPDCSTLVMHPITSAWMCYDNGECDGLSYYNDEFVNVINNLESKHIQFHLGDELLMERIARVDGAKMVVGDMEYSTIVLPPHIDFLKNTKALLSEFEANGGKIVTADEISPLTVVNNSNITYLKRVYDDFDLHYFVNSTQEYQVADIAVDGVMIDIMTGDEKSFDKHYTFAPMDSLMVIDYRDGYCINHTSADIELLTPNDEFNIVECSENCITLDRCECYFDDNLEDANMPVISIQDRACEYKRPIKINLVFRQNIAYIPDDICLVCETPDIYKIKINSVHTDFVDCGSFCDSSFRKMNIAHLLRIGDNTIEFECDFVQSEATYESFENSPKCQSIRNKHTYDMEIECPYLVGSFSVKCDGEFEAMNNNAVRYNGDFIMDKPKNKILLCNIEQQGYPFFAGKMVVEKTICVEKSQYEIMFDMKGVNAVSVEVNGTNAGTVIWQGTRLDLSSYLRKGENTLRLTIYNNLRNMLGPHHLEEGECLTVRPVSFFRDKNMWLASWLQTPPWNDDYCFVETSITF